jgi:hypothetical protein
MNSMLTVSAFVLVLLVTWTRHAHADWSVVVPDAYADEEGIKFAIADLNDAAGARGIAIHVAAEGATPRGDAISVGSPERNAATRRLTEAGAVTFEGVANPEGYEIATVTGGNGRTIVVAGGSVLGDVYGLYWVWDRLRVTGRIPDINVKREPALEYRYTRIEVQSEADIRRALRYGLNLVYGENPLRLISWNAEPEDRENEAHRARTRELAAYAHALHLKFLAFGTDFTYHPALLKEFGATCTPTDPKFWEALQEKYRRLFRAMPELDGAATFTADEQRFWGNYETFDVMHDGEGCDWSLAKRYRTYVTKMWEVVVGECDKLLLHRTWATNTFEQQAQAEVYRDIFTDAVPTKNLFLIPSFTQNDRWWFQAYNPTINQTPHNTMIVCESMDYHAGGNLFPTYPGPYFQAGLQTMLDAEESNLKGLSLDMPGAEDWHTRTLTAYTVSRLAWNHHEDIRAIAEDFAAIHFGQAAAEGMSELLLMSPVAYKYGLYIEPAAYGEFNSLPHIRVGQFVAQGYNRVDSGKEHIAFLRALYLRCKPWRRETLLYLDHGLDTAEAMCAKYATIRDHIEDPAVAEDVANALALTQMLVRTNNRYVKAMFAYFRYREEPADANKRALAAAHGDLARARDEFANAPGFGYQLFGVDQLLLNTAQALDDLERAEQILADAPTAREIEEAVAEEQAKYAEVLASHADDAVKILHWRGKIDGRDILRVRGSEVSVEHLRWDPAYVERSEILAPLPERAGTVVPRNVESRPLHPFVLEQPSEENGFTAEIYMNDLPGGADWWEFELYFIPRPPTELGVRPSLKVK